MQFFPGRDPATIRCANCGVASPAPAFPVHEEHRVEGPSDPDAAALVVAASCPTCGTGGAIILGDGPGASPADADIADNLS